MPKRRPPEAPPPRRRARSSAAAAPPEPPPAPAPLPEPPEPPQPPEPPDPYRGLAPGAGLKRIVRRPAPERPADTPAEVPGRRARGEVFRAQRVAKISTEEDWKLGWVRFKEKRARERFEEWVRRGERAVDRVTAFRQYLKRHGIVPSPRYRQWLEEGQIPAGQVPDFENWAKSRRIAPKRVRTEFLTMESRMEDPAWRSLHGHEYPGDRRRWMAAVRGALVAGLPVPRQVADEYQRMESFARGETQARRASARR